MADGWTGGAAAAEDATYGGSESGPGLCYFCFHCRPNQQACESE